MHLIFTMKEASELMILFREIMHIVRRDKKEEFIKKLLDSIGDDIDPKNKYIEYNKLDNTSNLNDIVDEKPLDDFDKYMI
jgi:hypothetical protein